MIAGVDADLDVDVAIVGAGPTGLTTANILGSKAFAWR